MKINSHISFEDALYGRKTGFVRGLIPDIGNGQQHAIIELDHELPGLMQSVPVADLNHIKVDDLPHK